MTPRLSSIEATALQARILGRSTSSGSVVPSSARINTTDRFLVEHGDSAPDAESGEPTEDQHDYKE
jgi:hypothetical protein